MLVERKYLAHFIDANMVSDLNSNLLPPSGRTNYVRIGKHLEAFAEELNPQIEQHKNILGEQVVIHSGYEPAGSVDKFYAESDNPLYTALETIVLDRLCGEDCRTTCVDAMIEVGTETSVLWAYKEDCYLIPQSYGGDTSGIQIPFQVIKAGNRVRVYFSKGSNGWVINGLG